MSQHKSAHQGSGVALFATQRTIGCFYEKPALHTACLRDMVGLQGAVECLQPRDNCGTFLAPPVPQGVDDIFEVRLLVEAGLTF